MFFDIFKKKVPLEPKMYVLVLNCLEDRYKIIQGSHAVCQYALDFPDKFTKWDNKTVVYLGVRNPEEIIIWTTNLECAGKNISYFREPDLYGIITAVACYDTGEIFKDLKLA